MSVAAQRLHEVSAPKTDALGSTLLRDRTGYYAAFAYHVGESGAIDTFAQRSAATLLARFRNVFRERHEIKPFRTVRSADVLASNAENFEELTHHIDDPDKVLPTIAPACRNAERILRGLALSTGIVHGDAHPGNIVSILGRANGLIDFDYTHETERTYDLAVAIATYYGNARETADAGCIAGTLTEAFDATAPLTEDERRGLLPLVVRRITAMLLVDLTSDESAGRKVEKLARAAADLRAFEVAEAAVVPCETSRSG